MNDAHFPLQRPGLTQPDPSPTDTIPLVALIFSSTADTHCNTKVGRGRDRKSQDFAAEKRHSLSAFLFESFCRFIRVVIFYDLLLCNRHVLELSFVAVLNKLKFCQKACRKMKYLELVSSLSYAFQ